MEEYERRVRLVALNAEELETLRLLCSGMQRQDVADKLIIAASTVYYRLGRIAEKLKIDHLDQSERNAVLFRDYCPLVLESEDTDGGATDGPSVRGGGSPVDTGHPPQAQGAEVRYTSEESGASPGEESVEAGASGDGARAGLKQSAEDAPDSVEGDFVDIDHGPDNGGVRRDILPPIQLHTRRTRTTDSLRRPIIVASVLLCVVAVLLALNLFRPARDTQPRVVVVTATSGPTVPATEAVQTDAHPGGSEPTAQPTHTPYPTQTPLPTYTPYPTQTPLPTYTPYPSPTEGRLPTGTPRPTYTPCPTQPTVAPMVKLITWTPVPTPTEPERTPSDAVLEVGDWWKEDGVWLRIASVQFDERGHTDVKLEMWNRTGGQLVYKWSRAYNLLLQDNLGHEYTTEGGPWWGSENTEILAPGERRILSALGGITMEYNDNSFFNAAVSDMWFTVTDMSRISFAKWHIVVPK